MIKECIVIYDNIENIWNGRIGRMQDWEETELEEAELEETELEEEGDVLVAKGATKHIDEEQEDESCRDEGN